MAKIPVGQWTMKGLTGRLLKGFAINLLSDVIIKPITTFVSVLFMWGFHAIMKISPKEGSRLIKLIGDTYSISPQEWIPWVTPLLNQITGGTLKAEDLQQMPQTGAVTEIMRSFSDNVMTNLLNTIVPSGETTSAKAMEAAGNFMSVNMQFQMSSWLLHLLGDIQSFGMFKSLKDLPNAISWSFGIGWLSWLVMGTPFQLSIVEGLRWKFNAQLRPSRLSVGQLHEALRRGEITAEEWNSRMEQEGWRDVDKAILYHLSEKDYSDAFLRDALFLGWLTEAQVLKELNKKGFSRDRAISIIHWWQADRKRDLLEKIYKEYEDLYKDDRVTSGDLMSIAGMLGYDSQEKELLSDLADLKKIKAKSFSDSNVKQLLDAGLIGTATATRKLLNVGWSIDDANMLIRLWTKEKPAVAEVAVPAVKVVTPEEKELSKAEVISLYEGGFINHPEATTRLMALDYNEQDALLILAPVAKRIHKDYIIDKLARGQINYDEAEGALLEAGWGRADVTKWLKPYLPEVLE